MEDSVVADVTIRCVVSLEFSETESLVVDGGSESVVVDVMVSCVVSKVPAVVDSGVDCSVPLLADVTSVDVVEPLLAIVVNSINFRNKAEGESFHHFQIINDNFNDIFLNNE